MKKFIKKTIAGLIAGVMAVSSMPFTALANDYSEFDTMKSQMASFTAYQPSAHGSFSGDKDYTNYEDHYKGLLYAEDVKDYSATGSVQLGSDWTGSNSTYANLYFPTSVALYTDDNEITVPIMISASTSRSGTWDCKFRAHSGVISGDGLSLVNNIWNGKDEKTGDKDNWYANGNQTSHLPAMNFMWTINQTSYKLSTDATNSPTNSDIDPGYGKNAQIWANKVKVSPTFSNSTSVETKSYKPEIKFYVSGKKKNIDTGKSITLTSSDAVTVINYQPYLNKLATVKSDVASMDATKYTVDSVKAYVVACNKFLNINPLAYSYSTDTKAVDSLVEAMNKAMTDYDLAKKNLEKLPQIEQSYIDSYNNALKEAEAKALNPNNRYTVDSINALKAEIASVKTARDSVKTNEELEALTTRLLTAISNLVQAKFNVVFVTVGLDSTTENEKYNDYIEYGETYNADAGANVKKWVVTTDNGNTSTVIDNFDQKASFVITKDAKIYAYLSGEDSSKTSSKVTFLGRHNQVVAIRYVADGKTLETKDVDAPSIPFYKFEKWDVASVKGDGNEYTVKASYTCKQTSEFCTVHFGDWSQAYAYDSYVYLPNTVAGTKYALYSDEQCTKLLTVLDGVDFYAPKTSDIYVKAYDAEATVSIAVTGSFAEKDEKSGKNYANFNCKFYLPAGADAIEWGVQVKSPDGTKTANVKGEKLSERNEYTVRFGTSSSSVTSITGRAYLVYVQDGVKTTIYSPEFVTVNLNA